MALLTLQAELPREEVEKHIKPFLLRVIISSTRSFQCKESKTPTAKGFTQHCTQGSQTPSEV